MTDEELRRAAEEFYTCWVNRKLRCAIPPGERNALRDGKEAKATNQEAGEKARIGAMSFPVGWTGLDASAMQWFRSKRGRRLENLWA